MCIFFIYTHSSHMLKCILYPRNFPFINCHAVIAHFRKFTYSMFKPVVICHSAYFAPLAPVNGFCTGSCPTGFSGFYLKKNQAGALVSYDIDFTLPASVVHFQNTHTFTKQKLHRFSFVKSTYFSIIHLFYYPYLVKRPQACHNTSHQSVAGNIAYGFKSAVRAVITIVSEHKIFILS